MEIKITVKHVLIIAHIIAWIIFVGLCIEAGAILTNGVVTFYKPESAKYVWQLVDLSDVYAYDNSHFFTVLILMAIVAILKACLFYKIVIFLHDKKLNLQQPFNNEVAKFILQLCYMSFGVGIFSASGLKFTIWLIKNGVTMPNVESLGFGGADVWLFMGVILFIIAQIFKRGIEIQKENELTV